MFEYIRVGPNSEDIVRVRPLPNCMALCLGRGEEVAKFLASLGVVFDIANESNLLWARLASSVGVAMPFEGLESREGWTERLNLFISLEGIEERVRGRAWVGGQLALTPPSGLFFSVSRFIDQPCHRP